MSPRKIPELGRQNLRRRSQQAATISRPDAPAVSVPDVPPERLGEMPPIYREVFEAQQEGNVTRICNSSSAG